MSSYNTQGRSQTFDREGAKRGQKKIFFKIYNQIIDLYGHIPESLKLTESIHLWNSQSLLEPGKKVF